MEELGVFNRVDGVYMEAPEPHVTDAPIAQISNLRNLRSLSFYGAAVTDAATPALLSRLNLPRRSRPERHPGLRTKGLPESPASCLQLKKLILDDTSVAGSGFEHLSDLSNLAVLSLNNNRSSTIPGLAHLRRFKKLEGLHLDGTQITDRGLVHLSALTELTHLSIDGTEITVRGGITETNNLRAEPTAMGLRSQVAQAATGPVWNQSATARPRRIADRVCGTLTQRQLSCKVVARELPWVLEFVSRIAVFAPSLHAHKVDERTRIVKLGIEEFRLASESSTSPGARVNKLTMSACVPGRELLQLAFDQCISLGRRFITKSLVDYPNTD